jgi:hypothetical protein
MEMNNLEEKKKYFFWYYSEKIEDYFSMSSVHGRCQLPCEEDHPHYWSNIPFKELTELDRNVTYDWAVFGCSITFGAELPIKDTWPYLWGKKNRSSVLNFGTPGSGMDGIWQNIKASSQDWKFKKVIILFPNFHRKIASFKTGPYILRWPVGVTNSHPTPWDWNYYQDPIGQDLAIKQTLIDQQSEKTRRELVDDKQSIYSKKALDDLVKFCESKYETFYATWDIEVEEYLATKGISRLPMYDISGPKARDGIHPTRLQNQRFVDNIMKEIH